MKNTNSANIPVRLLTADMKNCRPKNQKMCDPILVNSIENGTP